MNIERPLVYDVGFNHGRTFRYYLEKGCRVIGVEANPSLVRQVAAQYAPEIDAGLIRLVNVGVGAADDVLPFHVNHTNDLLSSFVPPTASLDDEWETVEVPVRRLSEILLEESVDPMFVKIDVEGVDVDVLADLHLAGLRPERLSAEAHSIEVVCRLIAMGYTSFHLINGREVGGRLPMFPVHRLDGSVGEFRFELHAAGPFGNDLPGPWHGPEAIVLQWLGREGLFGPGWFDVHATGHPGPVRPAL